MKRELTLEGQLNSLKPGIPGGPLPEPVPPVPNGGWAKKVYIATEDFGVYYTSNFVTNESSIVGVPTWATVNTGLNLAVDCLGFRGDPYDPEGRQYYLGTDALYRRVAPGNWVSILTQAQAAALAPGGLAATFGSNAITCNINVKGFIAVGAMVTTGVTNLFGWCVSTNYGATWVWRQVLASATSSGIFSLEVGALKGSSPYAAGTVWYCGILRLLASVQLWYSLDNGATWATAGGLGIAGAATSILVDPNDQSRVFIGAYDVAGEWRVGVSTNHGVTVTQYDAAAPERLGMQSPYYGISVCMDSLRTVRFGGVGLQHIHRTQNNGAGWTQFTAQYLPVLETLGISLIQDAPSKLYLLDTDGTVVGLPHVVYASENESVTMVPKAGANANVAGTGGGDSIPYDCGGVVGILQVWTARAKNYVPTNVPSHDLGSYTHTGELSYQQLAGLVGTGADTIAAGSHAAQHENGGADEVSVAGLSGLLADDQNPVAHAADHEDLGADEISVGGLSGLLADPQDAGSFDGIPLEAGPPLNTEGIYYNSVAGEWQYAGAPPPGAHAASHENLGGDEISVAGLSGQLADAQPPLAHDHTAAAGDGGILTNDEHDGYEEIAEIAAPGNPAANKVRFYCRDDGGTSKLYFRDSAGAETEVGGAAPPVDFTIWEPDAPPASAGAADDEFDDGALAPAWTEVDFDGNLTVTEVEAGVVLTQTTHAGISIAGIHKSIPAGDFTIWAKINLMGAKINSSLAHLTLWEDPTNAAADLYTISLQNSATGPDRVEVIRWNAYNSYNSTLATLTDVVASTHAYLRIRRTGTTYAWDYSTNGIGWHRLLSAALGGGTPTAFGLSIDNQNTGLTLATLDSFFRYVASDVGVAGIVGGDRINGWRA